MEDKNKTIKDAEVVHDSKSSDTTTSGANDTKTNTDAAKPDASATNANVDNKNTESSKEANTDTTAPETAKQDTAPKPDAATATAAAADPTTKPRRWSWLAFIAGVVTAVLLAQLYQVVTNTTAQSGSGYPDPIATIDGVPVDQRLFEQNASQTLAAAEQQGVDTTDEAVRTEIETGALDTIINTRLLVSAAAAAGYEPTEEEIDAQIAELETQFGGAEALDAELDNLGLTRDELRRDVAEQISVDTLLSTEVVTDGIEVTQEEIQQVYDELVASGQDMPELESVTSAIESQITQQKQQEQIEAYLEGLRDAVDIEINL